MRPRSTPSRSSSASRISGASRIAGVVIGSLLFVSLSNAAMAQRGGGMGGGRGGGMGGGRGGGGGGRGGSAESPSKRIKSEFDASDPVQFLLKRDKPLKLEKIQKDSLKSLHKDLDAAEKPIFSDVEKVFADAQKNAQQARDDGDDPAPAGGAGGRGARRMPDGVRELVAKLTDTQSAFNDRARAQLNDGQRHIADSLKTIYDAELRDKEAKQRPQGGGMGGRRGR